MLSFTCKISFALLLFLSLMSFNGTINCSGSSRIRCHQSDRRLLQIFKEGVNDSSNRLSSWSTEQDFCAWKGVHCDNITARVTRLDLSCSYEDYCTRLRGEINLSLLELEFLNYLDLCYNDFETLRYPSIHSKIYHNQSLATSPLYANFSSRLHYVDFSHNDDLQMDNLHWLSLVPSLKYLDLSSIYLHNHTNWLQSLAMLPSLSELRLSWCQLSPSLKYINFTSLVTLDLSSNYFQGQMPKSLLNSRNLKTLDMCDNQLNGSIPNWLGELELLQDLYLCFNLLSDPLPSSLGNLSSLVRLDVRSNGLTGNLPEWLGQSSKLESLLVGENSLTGILSEAFFNRLPNLNKLDLENSTFVIDLDPNWIPPFQLHLLILSHFHLGPKFPSWIYTQRSIKVLDISSSGISSIDKDKFWNLTANSNCLDASNNSISGDLSDVLLNAKIINLALNNFKGGLPHISANVEILDISHNSFSGSMFPLLCHSGKRENSLWYLEMSNNLLSGGIPDCWANWKDLSHIYLGSNRLTGELPSSMGSLLSLQSVDVHNNSLSGRITTLRQQSLEVLELSSNHLTGNIPSQLCQLTSLIVLDVANNKFSGSIPQCIYNITAMTKADPLHLIISIFMAERYWYEIQEFKHILNIKGLELEYFDNLRFMRIIDLSTNNLTGVIPPEIFKLTGLVSLNLSHNHLMGKIQMDIGDMKHLESLDHSDNKLSGEIPQSISNLNFLIRINLSYNDFSGQIPSGSQLQTFEAWSYIGNPQLCGAPLTKNCTEEENLTIEEHEESGTESWFFLGMGVGFAVGFWGVCGAIFLNRPFRHAYFRLLDRVADKMYVVTALKFNMFR